MKIIFKIILLFTTVPFLHATLSGTYFIQKDIQVLDELDIKSIYIKNPLFQEELKKRLKYTRGYTKNLNNGQLFIPQIKKLLKENNIPSSFLYLVMAESNFILNAASHKKAKGLWQFMPKTGERYGLEVNRYIDERMDIIKSTNAAISYFKSLHKRFDKWYLVAIAYNCGEGRVIEGITRATIDMYCDDVGYEVCRKESKIKAFRKTISAYQAKRVKFSKIYKIYKEVIQWEQKPDIEQLLNVQKVAKRQYIPHESRGYIRKIIIYALMNNNDFLVKDENTHLLNRGISDSIASIDIKGGILLKNVAHILGMKKDILKELNQHILRDIIPMDRDTYKLYIPYSKLTKFKINKNNLRATPYSLYIVRAGDTLDKISKKYHVDYQIIKKQNNLRTNIIRIGQELVIPRYSNFNLKTTSINSNNRTRNKL